MNYLALVQSLHNEAKLAGSAPSGVAAQTGRAADLVRWVAEAWNDIQRAKDGRWKWMLGEYTLDTVASDNSYAYTDATDVDDSAAISRFKRWELDSRELPHIYLVSDGEATEREMQFLDWRDWRYYYLRGTHDAAYPAALSVDRNDNLRVGPTPDGIYRISGTYWKSLQTLAADTDTPEMPADYHMLIVWRAITKFGYNVVDQPILARAQAEGDPLWDALTEDQAYSRFSFSVGDALA